VESYLDEINPTEPTPEVMVTNGKTTAAIEVKRMAGDSVQQEYKQSLYSNEKYLIPSCGGYYWLNPPVDLRLPLDTVLRRKVKREIERVAPTLKPEEKGVLCIPRTGHISLISEHNPPLISCSHGRATTPICFGRYLSDWKGNSCLWMNGWSTLFSPKKGKRPWPDREMCRSQPMRRIILFKATVNQDPGRGALRTSLPSRSHS
jgi:hypothetical protein